MVTIDYAYRERAPQYEALLRAAFGAYVQKLGRTQSPEAYDWLPKAIADRRVICACSEGTLDGVGIFSDEGTQRTIEQLAVHPTRQRGGVGSALIQWIEQDARDCGRDVLVLDTAEVMTDLIRLYERHGFVIERSGPPSHGRDKFTRVFMRKLL